MRLCVTMFQFNFVTSAGKFHKLDYGSSKNLKLYGSRKPPEYNLTNIRTKVHIMYGTHDLLVREEVNVLKSGIKHLIDIIAQSFLCFHL